MSERRFTKLKATLSEHGTAAKTRETVSRGLRESLNVNNDSSLLTCVNQDYEDQVRRWEDELKQTEDGLISRFLVNDHEDIKCLDKPKDLKFDFNQHYPQDKIKITSPFSHECIKHYIDAKHLVNYVSMAKYFGTVFDTFILNKSSSSTSSDFGEMFTSKSFLTNFPLRPHVFECDEDEYESGFCCGQKMLIREGHASVIDTGDGDFINGWLTLSRDEHDCFLTFCDTHRRNKILWHIEVNKKVEKLPDDRDGFQVNSYIIRTDHSFIDDWIKDINSHIFNEFTPEEELERILKRDSEVISEKLKSYELINNINLFAAYNDLNLRKDFLSKFTEDINCINHEQSSSLKHFDQSKKIFKFLLTIKSTDIAANDRSSKSNFAESYFYRISLFDCKLGKISEEFLYAVSPDINTIRSSGLSMEQNRGYDPKILSTVNRALFKVDLNQSNPNDLYLVLRVERTVHRLSNYICYPIVSAQMSNNNNNKINHQSIISQHSEPYAWSIRPLFHSDTLTLETSANFGVFYKMDQNRLSDDFICNVLNQLSQSISTRSQTVISGRLEIELVDYKTYTKPKKIVNESSNSINNNNDLVFNPSLFVQHNNPKQSLTADLKANYSPILEIQSLRLLSVPHTEFFNILYIYPQSLKIDSQRVFSKARNLCVTVEIRDDDNVKEAKPLNIIYGRAHDKTLFVNTATTSVSRHNVSPDFFEEIKVALPLYFSEKLHILFTISHISCKKECSYTVVGYSWLPISSEKHQIHCQNMSLSIFASLPNNYLSCQSLGLGKGLSMPDVKVVGKDVFKVSLWLTSSIISRDFELHTTLLSIIKITKTNRDDSKEISHIISLERQIPKMLRNLVHCDQTELVHFSQIIMQQLFKLMVCAASQDLIQESLNTIICLADKFRRENNLSILHEFIYSTFYTTEFGGLYVHDQLIILLSKMFETFNQKSANSLSHTEEMKLLLSNLWFLLQIIIKSMVQYLLKTDRISMKREDRFDAEFVTNLKSFFEESSMLISTFSRMEEAQDANRALAHFMTRLCSFFDRSIIFNAFFHHVNILSSRDIVIQELKFNSIATLLSHEHFVCYCNPMQLQDTPVLTIDFSSKHFPVFLILNEFKSLYHQSAASVRQIRQSALSIIRNQLTKHMLDDRYSDLACREKVLALYLPILSVILENSNRMMDSTVSSNPNTCSGGGGGGPHLTVSSQWKHHTSSFSTIHEQHQNTLDTLNALLVRSSSEISSTLSSISSYGSTNSNSTIGSANTLTHSRTNCTSVSATTATTTVRFDKFSHEEIRDLFVCFLCVVQVINTERMNLLNKKQLKDLFLCLECAINCFEYKPKKFADHRSKTMPNPIINHHQSGIYHSSFNHHSNTSTTMSNHGINGNTSGGPSENHLTNYLLQQNLSIQSALITLRTIHLYLDNDQEPIDHSISQILSIYLTLMTLPQSQSVLIHLFNSIRYFMQKFSVLLFNSDAFLSPIISKVIKYCNSSLTPIRQGATDLLYCLFVTNMKRTRFETIVCVSRLASSDPQGLIYLHSSLNRLEQLAMADMSNKDYDNVKLKDRHSRKHSPEQDGDDEEISVTNIVERIREILKATKQIREECFDPYSASELRLQLANSYARTSRSLLRTWLENLSEVHIKNHDWPEAAMCLCQVIAILIEQLSSKEIHIIDGMLNISKVSDNIMTKDNIKRESDWLELEESHVSIEVFESIINECVGLFEKGELFELAPHVLKVLMSTYEKDYEHKKLSLLYTKIAKMHSKALEINDSGKRIFDTFFRVAFYYLNTGQKLEYIYKMTKLVSLSEMTTRMQAFYPNATFLAADSPAIQQIESNSNQEQTNSHINENGMSNGGAGGCDLSAASKQCSNLIIVITHVNPYIENARNQFEKHVGVQQFVYEQRLDGKIAQSVADQYKKRVILTAAHSFPYFLKRIPVICKKEVILNPIDVAIDEMQERVHQLEHVIMNQDAKHLQLVLQGSVHVTVNCGPIAYANAFLKSGETSGDDIKQANGDVLSGDDKADHHFEDFSKNLDENQKHLKFLFEQFLDLCESALKLNERLIKANQTEYHNNLKLNFEKLKNQLDFLNHRPTYIPIFDAISGSTFSPFS